MLSVSMFGDDDLNKSLSRKAKAIKNRLPLMRKLGEAVTGSLQKNMTRGVDPNGRNLKPVAPWVRAASKTTGRSQSLTNIKPLLSTGQMRASIAPQVITNDRVEVMGTGRQQLKINSMTNGTPGRMAVSVTPVRGLYSGKKTSARGNQYVRINTPIGWRTKRVSGGTIAIRPRKRKFLFLGRSDVKRIDRITNDYIKEAIAK